MGPFRYRYSQYRHAGSIYDWRNYDNLNSVVGYNINPQMVDILKHYNDNSFSFIKNHFKQCRNNLLNNYYNQEIFKPNYINGITTNLHLLDFGGIGPSKTKIIGREEFVDNLPPSIKYESPDDCFKKIKFNTGNAKLMMDDHHMIGRAWTTVIPKQYYITSDEIIETIRRIHFNYNQS